MSVAPFVHPYTAWHRSCGIAAYVSIQVQQGSSNVTWRRLATVASQPLAGDNQAPLGPTRALLVTYRKNSIQSSFPVLLLLLILYIPYNSLHSTCLSPASSQSSPSMPSPAAGSGGARKPDQGQVRGQSRTDADGTSTATTSKGSLRQRFKKEVDHLGKEVEEFSVKLKRRVSETLAPGYVLAASGDVVGLLTSCEG